MATTMNNALPSRNLVVKQKFEAPRGISKLFDVDISFTTKEERIVILACKHQMRNNEIAAELNTTEGTIKNYMISIFDKTGMSARSELMAWFDLHFKPENKKVTVNTRKYVFTSKETAILILACGDQMKNKEIATKLNTTEQVIKNVVRVLHDKTGMSNRLELTAWFDAHYKNGDKEVIYVNGNKKFILIPKVSGNSGGIEAITKEERRILARLIRGISVSEIGLELDAQRQIIEYQIGNIIKKLGVKNLPELVSLLRKKPSLYFKDGNDIVMSTDSTTAN